MKGHKKICWNCEGYIHVYELQCPYCGVDLTPPPNDKPTMIEDETDTPLVDEIQASDHEEIQTEHTDDPLDDNKENFSLTPLLLLLPGSVLFLFGLALFLFSHDGFLTLQFEAKRWFIYFLASVPLLYFGIRPLLPMREKTEEPEPTSDIQTDISQEFL